MITSVNFQEVIHYVFTIYLRIKKKKSALIQGYTCMRRGDFLSLKLRDVAFVKNLFRSKILYSMWLSYQRVLRNLFIKMCLLEQKRYILARRPFREDHKYVISFFDSLLGSEIILTWAVFPPSTNCPHQLQTLRAFDPK